MNNAFVKCDARLRAEGRHFRHVRLNVASRKILNAKHRIKTRGLRLTGKWNSGERCAACRHTKQPELRGSTSC